MRIHQNLRGSTNPVGAAKLSMPRMPVEWLDAGSWRLPSGKALAEFALQAGFLAPLLFRTDRRGARVAGSQKATSREPDALVSLSKNRGAGE